MVILYRSLAGCLCNLGDWHDCFVSVNPEILSRPLTLIIIQSL